MTTTSHSRFLGLDTQTLRRECRSVGRWINTWPVFAWLSPVVTVRLLQVDARQSLWQFDGKNFSRAPQQDAQAQAGFFAVELPQSMILQQRLQLPPLPPSELQAAAELQARSISPFAPDDLAWGCAPCSGAAAGAVDLVLASRSQALRHMQHAAGSTAAMNGEPEAWTFADGVRPVVLSGFGEQRRLDGVTRGRLGNFFLLAVTALLLLALLLTPVLQKRRQAIGAVRAWDALNASVGPLVDVRAALTRDTENAEALAQMLSAKADPLLMLDAVTKALPDDAVLRTLYLHDGNKIEISGTSANATALMQTLSSFPGLVDVRHISPVVRNERMGVESFNISARVEIPATPQADAQGETP